ncbi:MAG: hypothetical protein M3472_05360 [Chloroflexota bacterium]|nr:hypothetical protein [Chloroflexota bacterium]
MKHRWVTERFPALMARGLDPIRVQGLYYVATGIWPVLHLRSFLFVTGPKHDTWLVKTFGLLVAAIGTTLVAHDPEGADRSAVRLAVASALALTACEIVFVERGRISPIYLADAAVELAFAASIVGRSRRETSIAAGSEADDDPLVRGQVNV